MSLDESLEKTSDSDHEEDVEQHQNGEEDDGGPQSHPRVPDLVGHRVKILLPDVGCNVVSIGHHLINGEGQHDIQNAEGRGKVKDNRTDPHKCPTKEVEYIENFSKVRHVVFFLQPGGGEQS